MLRFAFVRAGALTGLLMSGLWGQGPAGSLLIIEFTNRTLYSRDVADYSLLATKPGPTPQVIPRNFNQGIAIADIVSINGRRWKGTVLEVIDQVGLRPVAQPGLAVADITRNAWIEWYFEILSEDGHRIGSIMASGMNSQPPLGEPPPGQTSQIVAGSFTVVGGNGAFVGARGYMGSVDPASEGMALARRASMAEDPANRRINGSVPSPRQGIYVIPMFKPEIVVISGQPAIVHASDSSPVTAARPARAGEVLTLYASGLGPTRPGVEPGQPFPTSGLQVCNSPVEVFVNGRPGELLYCGGYPGAVDRYQVNFRVPEGIPSGLVPVQLTAAWIAGSDARIRVE